MRRTAGALILVVASVASAAGPDDAATAALADARRLPPGGAVRVRYLSLYAVPGKDRPDFLKALNYHQNCLSREAELVAPALVAPDLVRVNLEDYGIDPKTWDRLADADPHFHLLLEVEEVEEVEYGNWWYNGRAVDRGYPGAVWKTGRTEKKKTGKKTKQSAAAPWLAPQTSAALVALTQSRAPVVRADWFLYQTGIARKDSVSYYDFLGLGKKEADFQKLIGADPEASRRVKKEIAAILARSGVAINNRRVVRFQSLTGGYWITEDFKTSAGRQNVLHFLDGDAEPPKGDASEQYGVLPNGLFAFWLQNADGVRQDVVPPDIATDGHTAGNDRQIYGGIKSCTSCHVEGLRPIRDYARRIFQRQIPLQSPDYKKFVRLRQLYLSDLQGQLDEDTGRFVRVLVRLNGEGWTPARNARAYERAYDAYAEADLGVADAARDLGCTPDRLLKALRSYADAEQRRAGSYDPLIGGLLQDPEVPVRREQFDELFSLLQTILRTYP